MKVTEIFEARKKEGKPVLSFEIFPPKKEEALKNIDATLERLCDFRPRDSQDWIKFMIQSKS